VFAAGSILRSVKEFQSSFVSAVFLTKPDMLSWLLLFHIRLVVVRKLLAALPKPGVIFCCLSNFDDALVSSLIRQWQIGTVLQCQTPWVLCQKKSVMTSGLFGWLVHIVVGS